MTTAAATLVMLLVTQPFEANVLKALSCPTSDGSRCRRKNVDRDLKVLFAVERRSHGRTRVYVGISARAADDGVDGVVEYVLNKDNSLDEVKCHELRIPDPLDRARGSYDVRSVCDGHLLRLPVTRNPRGQHDIERHKPALPERDAYELSLGIGRSFLSPSGEHVLVAVQLGEAMRPAFIVYQFKPDGTFVSARCLTRLPSDGDRLSELRIAPVRIAGDALSFSDRCTEGPKSRDLVSFKLDADDRLRWVGRERQRFE